MNYMHWIQLTSPHGEKVYLNMTLAYEIHRRDDGITGSHK